MCINHESNKVSQMTDKALISELTWRSLEMQQAAFVGMPMYVAPHEISSMLRPTSRNEVDRIFVLSLGCIAGTEGEMRAFLAMAKKRGCRLLSREEGKEFPLRCPGDVEAIIKEWKAARRNGIQVIGGKRSAELRRNESLEAAAKIKDRWPQPSKIWPTHVLLKEVGKSLNTIKSILGPRPIAQYNYQAKLKRKAKKAKAA